MYAPAISVVPMVSLVSVVPMVSLVSVVPIYGVSGVCGAYGVSGEMRLAHKTKNLALFCKYGL